MSLSSSVIDHEVARLDECFTFACYHLLTPPFNYFIPLPLPLPRRNSIPSPTHPPLVTDGDISVPLSTKHQLGYVSQSSVSLSDKTLLDECISAVRDYDKIKLELEAVQQRVADGDFEDEVRIGRRSGEMPA